MIREKYKPTAAHNAAVGRGLRCYAKTRKGKEATAKRIAAAREARRAHVAANAARYNMPVATYSVLNRLWLDYRYNWKRRVAPKGALMPFEIWLLKRKRSGNGFVRTQATTGTARELIKYAGAER